MQVPKPRPPMRTTVLQQPREKHSKYYGDQLNAVTEAGHAWMHRDVYGLSRDDLWEMASLFNTTPARISKKVFYASVITPREFYFAMKRSPIRQLDETQAVAAELYSQVSDLLRPKLHVEVERIEQFGNWVAIQVHDESVEAERVMLSEHLSEIIGIEHDLGPKKPHISLFKGWLQHVSNLQEIQDTLPPIIELDRVTLSIGRAIPNNQD
ncbi:MAG: hypothetical protein WAV04_03765 [Candidatus Microsaccharimonas sp.]